MSYLHHISVLIIINNNCLILTDEQVELDGGVEISELPEKPEEQTEHFMSQSPAVSAPVVSRNTTLSFSVMCFRFQEMACLWPTSCCCN